MGYKALLMTLANQVWHCRWFLLASFSSRSLSLTVCSSSWWVRGWLYPTRCNSSLLRPMRLSQAKQPTWAHTGLLRLWSHPVLLFLFSIYDWGITDKSYANPSVIKPLSTLWCLYSLPLLRIIATFAMGVSQRVTCARFNVPFPQWYFSKAHQLHFCLCFAYLPLCALVCLSKLI